MKLLWIILVSRRAEATPFDILDALTEYGLFEDLGKTTTTNPPSDITAWILAVLSRALRLRFEHLRNVVDLEESSDVWGKALKLGLTPEGHQDRSGRLQTLGISLHSRYGRLGNVVDLEESIDFQRKALELTPEGHQHRSGRLQNLGVGLLSRYERLGNVVDLEESIRSKREALELTPEGHT